MSRTEFLPTENIKSKEKNDNHEKISVTRTLVLRNLAEDRSLDSILTAGGGGFLRLKASSWASMAEQSMEALVSLLTLMWGGMVLCGHCCSYDSLQG